MERLGTRAVALVLNYYFLFSRHRVGGDFGQVPKALVNRREIRRGFVEQLLETLDDKVGLLVAVDLVAGAHHAFNVQWQALGLGALH